MASTHWPKSRRKRSEYETLLQCSRPRSSQKSAQKWLFFNTSLLSLLLARSSYNLDLDEMGPERLEKKCLGFSLDRTINFQLQCLSFRGKKPCHYLTENKWSQALNSLTTSNCQLLLGLMLLKHPF